MARLRIDGMNHTEQEILDTLVTTVERMAAYLQQSGTIAVVCDMDDRILYANDEFAKRLMTKSENPATGEAEGVLPVFVRHLFSERVKAVVTARKPAVFDENIPFPNGPVSCLAVYFPVNNTAHDIVGIGMIGIPAERENSFAIDNTDIASIHNAHNDPLTGIPNRLSMTSIFKNEISVCERKGKPLTVVLINIDDFSKINREWGETTGDIVLVEFCELVKNHLRSSDRLGKWEDREFILVLPDTNLVIGSQIAERIRVAIENRQFRKTGSLTASFGVAVHARGETVEDCIDRADAAVYVAKMNGKNRVEVDRTGMNELALPDLKASHFLKLVWKSEYESGNTIIDYQHRLMVSDANHLLSAMLENKSKKQIAPLINKLLAHIQQHFDEEESILEKIGYGGTKEHALIHRQLLQKAVRLSVRFEENKLDFGEIFNFLANDIVIEHMIKTDKKFFPFLPEARN